MRVEESRTVTREEKVTVQTLCDCCGEPFKRDPVTTYEVEKRESYGSDGGTTEEFDVCPRCWKEKVAPLFKTGPHTIEW
jgi:hypothetical protein